MALPFSYKNGIIKIQDAGKYDGQNFWKTWYEGSIRLGTPINDIKPRNIGVNGIIFDPSLDLPITYGAIGVGVPVIGTIFYKIQEFIKAEDESKSDKESK